MIELEKKDLTPVLLSIVSYDSKTAKEISGLLLEEISMGTRRRLQRIRKDAIAEQELLQKDVQELYDDFNKKVLGKIGNGKTLEDFKGVTPDSENHKLWNSSKEEFLPALQKEINELFSEKVVIKQDKIKAEEIEKINTKVNYDWDLLEKILE